MEEKPLYNTRIIKSFAEYTDRYHPQIDMMPILDYAGITTYQLEDEGHWLTQTQVDRFYEILVKTVGDPDLARKVGQNATVSKAGGALSQYTLGFMTPSSAYIFLDKLYPHASRGSSIVTRKIGSNKVEVVAIQNPGVKEKPYQCENRLGTFEGIAKLFTNELATIEHKTCMHIDHGDCCVYNITWKTTPSFIWKRIANYSYILCLIICIFLFFILPAGYSASAILCIILVAMGISLYRVNLEKNELSTTYKNHCDMASNLLDEINVRDNNSIFIQEFGRATSMVHNIDKLLPLIMNLINDHLKFDHGMIMLSDSKKSQLIYKAGFGHNPDILKVLDEVIFHIDKPESDNAVVKTFLEQKPYLVDHIDMVEGDFSEKSINAVKHTGINLFICVPIVFEKESLGVLMVDNVSSKRTLLESDMRVMMGIASQIALSITNAAYLLKIYESEELFKNSMDWAPDGVFMMDFNGKFLYCNYKAEKITGFSREEFIGRNSIDLKILSEGSLNRAHKLLQGNIDGKEFSSQLLEIIRKDGQHIQAAITTTIVQQIGQKIVLVFVRDISAHIKADEDLRASQKRLRSLAGRLEQIREEERVIISREIHDVMGGGLTGLKMDLAWLMQKINNAESDNGKAAMISRIITSSESVDQMIKVTRRISSDLRPPVLDDLGLIAALEWQLFEFTNRTGIPHIFSTPFEYVVLERDQIVAVFRIFQETLTNIVRHSMATKIMVFLRDSEKNIFGDESLVLEVRDNGRGIMEEEIMSSKSLGLLGMKERALAFGGEFLIFGEPGGGTAVFIKIPRKLGGHDDQSYHS